jgi:hypothetical protein
MKGKRFHLGPNIPAGGIHTCPGAQRLKIGQLSENAAEKAGIGLFMADRDG